MTRIISGRLRGKKIQAPRNLPVRPTTDFAKESLFNILANASTWEELEVLDLFSGTGNLAYELASRGAQRITCVDSNPKCCNFIEKTAEDLHFEAIEVYRGEASDFLRRDYRRYDLILADPPYDYQDHQALVESVWLHNRLKEEGWLVIEHGRDTDLSEASHFWQQRRYGKVYFSFFQHRHSAENP